MAISKSFWLLKKKKKKFISNTLYLKKNKAKLYFPTSTAKSCLEPLRATGNTTKYAPVILIAALCCLLEDGVALLLR